jgi:hypothetical protein
LFSDEITESEEKSETSRVSSSLKVASNCSKNVGEKTNYESETESEQDSHHPDFLEKLDDLIKKFKYRTDGTVRNRRDSYIRGYQNEKSDISEHCLDEDQGKKLSIRILRFCMLQQILNSVLHLLTVYTCALICCRRVFLLYTLMPMTKVLRRTYDIFMLL